MTGFLGTSLVAGGFVAFLGQAPAPERDAWSLEAFAGGAMSAATPLVIRQAGEADIRVARARYETNAFDADEEAPYYAWRFGRWSNGAAWEAEQVHHMLDLANPPPEVGKFEVCDGYNFFFLNRAWARPGFVWRLGIGPIIADPESVVRGRSHHHPYELAGGGIQAGASTRVFFAGPVFLALEAATTAGWARVLVAGGHADVPNLALHGRFGLGAAL